MPLRIRAHRRFGGVLACMLAGVVACGEGGGGRPDVTSPPSSSFKPVLSWVKVSVSPVSIEVGATATARAEAFDQNGGPFSNTEPFTFQTSATTVATVDAAGTIRAIAPGTATITASAGGKSATRDVTVVPVAVAFIRIAPNALTLEPGASAALVATPYDATESVLAGRAVAWSSSDTMVAVVNSAGRVTARASGRAKITVGADSRSAFAVVLVTGAVGQAGDMLISFAVPQPGALVGDTLEVYADVSTSQPIARVEAMFNGIAIQLVKVSVGALSGSWLWHGVFDISGVHFGEYYVLVTATDARNLFSTDSVLFERNPVKKGGGSAGSGKTNKLVAPAAAPPVLPRRPRGIQVGKP